MRKSSVFLSLLLILLFAGGLQAQQMQQQLPLDPAVRYGKLDNGLTYYIRHNSLPEKQAEFYLVQKVGAMQEEDNQNGLAHFLEHMAFNNAKNFPTGIFDLLEKYGVQKGRNVNAYTSFDKTVYLLSGIPLTSPGIIDTALLILHDWSSYITLTDEDIDKERKVIKEEWRTGQNASRRIWNKQRPILFKDSKYALRDVIGDMAVVENFPYQTLKDYYNKWYRPDLQAMVIVGDFDVDQMEARIKSIGADLPKAVNPAQRIYYPIPDNDRPLVAIATDPEASTTSLSIMFKQDVMPLEIRNTPQGYFTNIVQDIASQIISERFAEISRKPEAPFSYAYGYYSSYQGAMTKDAWTLASQSKEGMVEQTFTILIRENERALRHGFTQGELDRAKANILQSFENRYNNRNSQYNASYVNPLVDHFLIGDPAMDIGTEYELVKQILAAIDLNMINRAKGISSDKNIVITMSGPEKESLAYPTEADLLAIMARVKAEDIAAPVEEVIATDLVSNLPQAGSIVKTEKGKHFDETVWTLSNGMKVVLKKTTNKDDEITIFGTALGGRSLMDEKDWLEMNYAGSVTGIGGLGEFNFQNLTKALAGKNAGVYPGIGDYNVSIDGRSSMKDMETTFQLLYLNFTSPRKDREAFEAFLERNRNAIINRNSDPNAAFSDSVTKTMFGRDNLRTRRVELEDLDRLDYDRMIELYRQSFANPGAFTLTFVGTVDEEAMKPLVEKYLASLAPGDKNVTWKKIDKDIRKGHITNKFSRKMETSRATVRILYSGTTKRDSETLFKTEVMNALLGQIFFRSIRKEEGGAYGVGAGINVARIPSGETTLNISYTTDPERVGALNEKIFSEINNLIENGPIEEEFKNAVEVAAKQRGQNVVYNYFWNLVLNDYHFYGADELTNYDERMRKITPADIQNLLKELVSQGNLIEVVMTPEAAK